MLVSGPMAIMLVLILTLTIFMYGVLVYYAIREWERDKSLAICIFSATVIVSAMFYVKDSTIWIPI